jgi:hypothetical protein
MLYPIEEVEARPGYHIWVRFEDGVEGEVDLSDLAGKGVFKAWLEPGHFEQVFVDPQSRTVTWPGGLDLAPDALYEDIVGVMTL